MFQHKTIIVYLTDTTAIIYTFQHQTLSVLTRIPWDGKNIRAVYEYLEKKLKIYQAALILSGNLCYVLTISLPSQHIVRASVQQEAQDRIPELLTNVNFDWKIISTNKTRISRLQVVAIIERVTTALNDASRASRVSFAGIEPIAVLLAEETKTIPHPHILLWGTEETVGVVAYQGGADFAEVITGASQPFTILEEYFRSHFPEQPIVTLVAKELIQSGTVAIPTHWQVTPYTFHPIPILLRNIAQKGTDEETLMLSQESSTAKPTSTTPVAHNVSAMTLIAAAITGCILGGALMWILLKMYH
ncbi:hypothetical protein HY468_04045 [Candidatus Roizmanbacteria bacterium]|nr:hypothetical protein [Candidatus Roizmanbacteria bacterium]